MYLNSVFGAEISEELINVHLANVKVLSTSQMSRAEICTTLMWTLAYFLVDSVTDSDYATPEQDEECLEQILSEFSEGLEDTAKKATISMRAINAPPLH